MSSCTITCGDCGVESDLEDWCKSPVYGRLKKNQYRCPNCRVVIERRAKGKAQVFASGLIIPPSMEVVRVGGVL